MLTTCSWVKGFAGVEIAVVGPPFRAACAGLKPGATGFYCALMGSVRIIAMMNMRVVTTSRRHRGTFRVRESLRRWGHSTTMYLFGRQPPALCPALYNTGGCVLNEIDRPVRNREHGQSYWAFHCR
jgi:hypothetical protein